MLNLKVKFRESSVRLPIPRIGRTEHRYNFVGKEASYSRRSALHIPKEWPEPRQSFYEDRLGSVCLARQRSILTQEHMSEIASLSSRSLSRQVSLAGSRAFWSISRVVPAFAQS